MSRPAGSSLMAKPLAMAAAELMPLSASAYDLSMTVAGARETLSRPNFTSWIRSVNWSVTPSGLA